MYREKNYATKHARKLHVRDGASTIGVCLVPEMSKDEQACKSEKAGQILLFYRRYSAVQMHRIASTTTVESFVVYCLWEQII